MKQDNFWDILSGLADWEQVLTWFVAIFTRLFEWLGGIFAVTTLLGE